MCPPCAAPMCGKRLARHTRRFSSLSIGDRSTMAPAVRDSRRVDKSEVDKSEVDKSEVDKSEADKSEAASE